MIHLYDGRRRPDQPQRDLRRGRHRRRDRPVRGTQPHDAAAGKRGKPSRRTLLGYFAARDWDAMAEILADDISHRRSPSGGERRGPARSGCRDRKHAGRRRRRSREHDVDRHRDPRRAPRPHSCPFVGPRLRPEEFQIEMLGIVEIDADERIAAVVLFDARRLRRRLRGTRRPIPRRRSGRPRAHLVGHCGSLRRAQPARIPATTPDSVYIDHRPLVAIESGDLAAYLVPHGTSRRTSTSTSRRCIG